MNNLRRLLFFNFTKIPHLKTSSELLYNNLQPKIRKDLICKSNVKFHRSIHQKNISEREIRKTSDKSLYVIALIGLSASAITFLYRKNNRESRKKYELLPTYTMREINEHCKSNPDSIWITYKGGVYDFSKSAAKHPGNEDTIAMAAASSIEQFWSNFILHEKQEILDLLETMRIGNLAEDDIKNERKMFPRCKRVKNVPKINPQNYKFELSIGDVIAKTLNLNDIKQYSKYSIASTIPCNSNKQTIQEYSIKEKTFGPIWTGTRLSDILREFDIKKDDYNLLRFECLDTDENGQLHSSTVTVDNIIDFAANILLAYEIDDVELTPEHGYPIRAVVVQLDGAKNVKWLKKIELMK